MSGGRGMGSFGRPEQPKMPKEKRNRTVRRIATFFRPYRFAVAVVLFTIVVTSLLGLINPYLLKLLIDEAIPQKDFRLLVIYVGLMIIIPLITTLRTPRTTWLRPTEIQFVQ